MRQGSFTGQQPIHDNDRHAAVLVVEDDALVRLDIVLALSDAGFAVVETDNGEDALELLRTRQSIGIVFTDVELPGMNGLALREEILERWPHVAVLVTSGAGGAALDAIKEEDGFFPKPYDSRAVISTVRAIAA